MNDKPYHAGAPQDGLVMVESSDKTWSTGEGNGKPFQYACLEHLMNSMKRQEDKTVKDKFPRLVGAQDAPREEWRNNSRKNEEQSQSENNTQLWMWLMMEVKYDGVKNIIA